MFHKTPWPSGEVCTLRLESLEHQRAELRSERLTRKPQGWQGSTELCGLCGSQDLSAQQPWSHCVCGEGGGFFYPTSDTMKCQKLPRYRRKTNKSPKLDLLSIWYTHQKDTWLAGSTPMERRGRTQGSQEHFHQNRGHSQGNQERSHQAWNGTLGSHSTFVVTAW